MTVHTFVEVTVWYQGMLVLMRKACWPGYGGGIGRKFVHRRRKTSFGRHTNDSLRFIVLHFHRNCISLSSLAFGTCRHSLVVVMNQFSLAVRVNRLPIKLVVTYLLNEKGGGAIFKLRQNTKYSCEWHHIKLECLGSIQTLPAFFMCLFRLVFFFKGD